VSSLPEGIIGEVRDKSASSIGPASRSPQYRPCLDLQHGPIHATGFALSDFRPRFWRIPRISAIFGRIFSTCGRLFGKVMKYQYLTKTDAKFEARSGCVINLDSSWTAKNEAKNNKENN
jgi:hypothetical protein